MLFRWFRLLRRTRTLVPLTRWTTGNPPRLAAPQPYWS
jgi:hypothetical protein